MGARKAATIRKVSPTDEAAISLKITGSFLPNISNISHMEATIPQNSFESTVKNLRFSTPDEDSPVPLP